MTNLPFGSAAQGTANKYLIVADYNDLFVNKTEVADAIGQVNLRRALVEAVEYGHKVILASEFRDDPVHREFLELKLRGIVPAGSNPASLFMHNNKVVTLYSEIQADPVAALGTKAANIYIGPRAHEDDVPHAQPGEITRPDISQRLRYVLNMPQLPEDQGFEPNVPRPPEKA